MNDKLKDIKLFIMDVDGVLTNSTIYIGDNGELLKTFNTKDGAGIDLLHEAGIETAIVTGRKSKPIAFRAKELNISHILYTSRDKVPAFNDLLNKTKLSPSQCSYIGDDLYDIPVMKQCGTSFAPADAAAEVLEMCTVRLEHFGGNGAVREAIELILKASGKWDDLVSKYS